jgi:hypothetical protein
VAREKANGNFYFCLLRIRRQDTTQQGVELCNKPDSAQRKHAKLLVASSFDLRDDPQLFFCRLLPNSSIGSIRFSSVGFDSAFVLSAWREIPPSERPDRV